MSRERGRGPGRLVLLGHPVAHSLSPAMQNAALLRAGVALTYEALDVAPDDVAAVLVALRAQHAAGNVTMPHKGAVAARCDRRTDVAERTGMVNTFWYDGADLIGDNTDVAGFEGMVRHLLGGPRDGAQVALLGAGGGAAAVLDVLREWPGVAVRLWARSAERARGLGTTHRGIVTRAESVRDACASASIVINATPVGLSGDAVPVDVASLRDDAAVMDLAYRRGETPWVRAARARGLVAADGRQMLVEQGAAAFVRWFGEEPDRAAMLAALA